GWSVGVVGSGGWVGGRACGSLPARRSSDLIARRGYLVAFVEVKARRGTAFGSPFEAVTGAKRREIVKAARVWMDRCGRQGDVYRDRKSTRLNSSHQIISSAVLCLKKKTHHP